MLDHPEKTPKLLADLKAAVPFEVELTEQLVKYLRAQHLAGADRKHHTVSHLSYAGDEGDPCHARLGAQVRALTKDPRKEPAHRFCTPARPTAWLTTQSDANPSQASNSLVTGKLTGNFANLGLF